MFLNATAPETDIIRVPCMIPVSNTGFGASSNGYVDNLFGTSKMYFSTFETSGTPTSAYRLYKWRTTASLEIASGTPVADAVYQTQSQMFSRKVTTSEVRVYGEPWEDGVEFSIDLMGSGNVPIANGSKTFTASAGSSNGIATDGQCIIGDDFAWYGPDIAPTYTLGVMITNLGETNFTINKIEIDWSVAGK